MKSKKNSNDKRFITAAEMAAKINEAKSNGSIVILHQS